MTDYSCGVPKEEVKLSDEQVDLLNGHEPVRAARTKFLQALRDATISKDESLKQEAKRLEVEYLRQFYDRLKWVVENPPEPKKAANKNLRGFGTHA